MKIHKYILLKIFALLFVISAIQAQDGPSLEKTLDWIEWKLEEYGNGSYESIYEEYKLDGFRIRSYLYKTMNFDLVFEKSNCNIVYNQEIIPDTTFYKFLKINAVLKFDLKNIELAVKAEKETEFLKRSKEMIFDEEVLDEFILIKTINENQKTSYSITREKWDVENYRYEKYDTQTGRRNYLLIHIADNNIRERLIKAFNHAIKKAKESKAIQEIF